MIFAHKIRTDRYEPTR